MPEFEKLEERTESVRDLLERYKELREKCAKLERDNEALEKFVEQSGKELEATNSKLYAINEQLKAAKANNSTDPLEQALKQAADLYTAMIDVGNMSDKEWEDHCHGTDSDVLKKAAVIESVCKGTERVIDAIEKTGIIERMLVTYHRYIKFCERANGRAKSYNIIQTLQNLFKGKGRK
jgi:predicted  nucleic acid-binding Zn-ribbon protein